MFPGKFKLEVWVLITLIVKTLATGLPHLQEGQLQAGGNGHFVPGLGGFCVLRGAGLTLAAALCLPAEPQVRQLPVLCGPAAKHRAIPAQSPTATSIRAKHA